MTRQKVYMVLLSLAVLLLVLWCYTYVLAHPGFAEVDPASVDFKTGDIILFHALDNVNHMMIFSYYCHVGIVYVDEEGRRFLFEAVNPDRHPMPAGYEAGIVLCDLDRRLHSYRGYVFLKSLNRPVSQQAAAAFKRFIQYAIDQMFYFVNVVENFFTKLLMNDPLRHGTNCGELVTLSLAVLGVLPEKELLMNRRHHLRDLGNLTTIAGSPYSYSEPVYLMPDQFAVKKVKDV